MPVVPWAGCEVRPSPAVMMATPATMMPAAISMRELMSFRRLPRMLENLRLSIMTALEERRRMRETMSQRREV